MLIAEAAVAGTPLVGRTLKDIRLAEHARVNVAGIWNRGRFKLAGPETIVEASSILLLAGTRHDLDEYDGLFCLYGIPETPVMIIGGGRVGLATARELETQGIDYRIVERQPEHPQDLQRYIVGDAADLETLERAGIQQCSSIVITTHDDDINIYLAIYCRRLRSDVQILARANQDRNVNTLHRAGADFVMSYASTGASSIYNILKQSRLLLLADGLVVFRVPVPPSLVGRSLAECRFRQTTGCNVIALERPEQGIVQASAHTLLPADAEMIIVGDAESEQRFFETMAPGKRKG